jgi:hypothetical protein
MTGSTQSQVFTQKDFSIVLTAAHHFNSYQTARGLLYLGAVRSKSVAEHGEFRTCSVFLYRTRFSREFILRPAHHSAFSFPTKLDVHYGELHYGMKESGM